MHPLTTRLLLIVLAVTALAVGLAGSAAATTGGPPRLFVYPGFVELTDGQTVEIFAFYCPVTGTGEADFGLDGVPGTADDDCVPALVEWSTDSGFGMVFPALGTSTMFTAALPPGVDEATTSVVAADSSGQTNAAVALIRRALEPEPEPEPVLVLEPDDLELPARDTQTVSAFGGPPDANGNPDVGADGIPGTSDDQFQAVSVDWATSGGIGTVDPASGSMTTLTAADTVVPLTGQVIATAPDGRMASSNVRVTAAALNIRTSPDTINLKAEGKYITAYIESGAGAVDVSQLDLASIRLQVVFPFGSSELPIAPGAPTAIGDDDGNGVADLAVKFDRATVQSWFPGPAEPIFRITAELLDVRRHVFGDAMARVIDQGSQHTSEDDHGSVQP